MTVSGDRSSMVRGRHHRRGGVSILAMLYLSLFAMLAITFSAMSSSGVQVAANQRRVQKAYLAAESGLQVARDFLLTVEDLPKSKNPDLSAEDLEAVWAEIQQHVVDRFSGTGNMMNLAGGGMQTVGILTDQVHVPQVNTSAPYGIWLESGAAGSRFAFTLTRSDDEESGEMVLDLAVTGMHGPTNRTARRRLG